MHRPFDGAFPAHYPADLAVRQCKEVLYRLMSYPNNSARDRAHTMLYMAEAGLHSFDYDEGRWVHSELGKAGLDEDAKHTVIVKLHPHPSVGKLLLQRCGMSSKWLTGNGARSLSRLMRHYQFSPAFTRNVIEHLGHDPDTYYMIGADYRIPEPSEEWKAHATQSLLKAGFSDETIKTALSDVGRTAWRTPPAETKQLNQGSSIGTTGQVFDNTWVHGDACARQGGFPFATVHGSNLAGFVAGVFLCQPLGLVL